MKKNNQHVESAIEGSPSWLKTSYIFMVRMLKAFLQALGLLKKLDTLAISSERYHYFRSLLAIHQLDDMIQLDVPWWTYEAISEIEKYIQNLDHKPAVFEYGSGASTIWLANRCDKIISVEHDDVWYENLKSKLQKYPNIDLTLKIPQKEKDEFTSIKMPNASFKDYVESIKNYPNQYDIIIIDGRCREVCLKMCLAYLKPNGIIIFDNSNRARYQQAINDSELFVKRYYGRVPGSPFKSETAILSR